LQPEQDHLAAVRAAMRGRLDLARHRVATGDQVAGDRYAAEVLGRMLKSHAKQLAEEPDAPPYFGRLAFDADAGDHANQRYYIGRRHVADDRAPSAPPLVVDWRAPVSRAFYRATHAATSPDRMGVEVRRRYGWNARLELTGFEDELLAAAPAGTLSHLVTEEIERPRVGPMRDIVATIQPDQDALVRAELDDSVCVQGAPGTGKTAVGLHRAAYLLYTHRRRLRRNGVLMIGPNRAFLQYISAVLPALGEVDVAQRTLESLLSASFPVSTVDTDEAAAVKHDVRMAAVLHRCLYERLTKPVEALVVADGSARFRVSAETAQRLVRETRAADVPYGVGRERLRARIVGLLQLQAERKGESPGYLWAQRIGRSAPVKQLLDTVWPAVKPHHLLLDLYADPSVADGILTAGEQALIARRRPKTLKAATWTPADVVLLDEAAGLIEHPAGFGHVIVDEAQDLSPMQCRVLARRSVHGSLTVLGDLAQGTTPWAASSWAEQLGHLGRPKAPVIPLTTGFRVPGAVLEVANRLLATLGVDVPPTRAIRTDGALRYRPLTELAQAVREALTYEGSIGVITADAALESVREAIAPDERITVLPASLAKGLEYDHVILVEPADIVEAEPRGGNRLYVVLTRAVSRLDIVHARPLPPAIDAPPVIHRPELSTDRRRLVTPPRGVIRLD
jgi:DNA helicase IV